MKPFLITLLLFVGSLCLAQNDFITTWNVKYDNQTLVIPIFHDDDTQFSVDWGDGTPITNHSHGHPLHTYQRSGNYQIKISGYFPRIQLLNSLSSPHLRSIDQWGANKWKSMHGAFSNCLELTIPATDAPDLSEVTDMSKMFYNCPKMNTPMNHWDVSNVRNMSELFRLTFYFNQALDQWDVSNVEDMSYMFATCNNYSQNLGAWDVSNVKNMEGMLYACFSIKGGLDQWDVSNVKNFKDFFYYNHYPPAEYDKLLISWSKLNLQANLEINFFNTPYCAIKEKQHIIDTFNWTFIDAGVLYDCDIFTTTWHITKNNESLTIPTIGTGYNFRVDWGDGSPLEYFEAGNPSHTYSDSGDYTIRIDGAFPRIFINANPNVRDKLISIDHWGRNKWKSMEGAFFGCENMVLCAQDAPDLREVTSLKQMFGSCKKMNAPLNHWDVSNIEDMSALFAACTSFNQPLDSWNVENVTDMTAMFVRSGFDQPIANWDVSKVENMTAMFHSTNFNQYIGDWNVSNVKEMRQMFAYCDSFNQYLNQWDVSNVVNMSELFSFTKAFNHIIKDWDVSNATDMSLMFLGAENFNQDITQWNVSKLNVGFAMFANCPKFNQDLSGWDISNAGTLSGIFDNCGLSTTNYDKILKAWSTLDVKNNIHFSANGISYCTAKNERDFLINHFNWIIMDDGQFCNDSFITLWKTSSTNEMISIPTSGGGYDYTVFWGDGTQQEHVKGSISHVYSAPGEYIITITGDFPTIKFEDTDNRNKIYDVQQWGSIKWATFHRSFYNCDSLNISATDAPDMSNLSDMSSMFSGCYSFNGDIGHWDVSNVSNMSALFQSTSRFNQFIGNWDVSKVEDMSSMFAGAAAFNSYIGDWDVSNVRDMSFMFTYNGAFNHIIRDWNTESVTNMQGMFKDNQVFNQDLSGWETKNVTDMSEMFMSNLIFQGDISTWNTSKVEDMRYMFFNTRFNQNINNWDVGMVKDMDHMFTYSSFNSPLNNWRPGKVERFTCMFCVSSFDQDIGNWDVSSAKFMNSMLAWTPFNHDIGDWDVSNVEDMSGMFDYNRVFNQDISRWDIGNVKNMDYIFGYEGHNVKTPISPKNYDKMLIAWSQLPSLQNDVRFDIYTSYCEGSDARQSIIDNYNWDIHDFGQQCSFEKKTAFRPQESTGIALNIYPNPVSSRLTLSNPGLVDLTSAEICDLMGQCIHKISTLNNVNTQSVNISHLSSGIYMLRINTNSGVITRRFTKE